MKTLAKLALVTFGAVAVVAAVGAPASADPGTTVSGSGNCNNARDDAGRRCAHVKPENKTGNKSGVAWTPSDGEKIQNAGRGKDTQREANVKANEIGARYGSLYVVEDSNGTGSTVSPFGAGRTAPSLDEARRGEWTSVYYNRPDGSVGYKVIYIDGAAGPQFFSSSTSLHSSAIQSGAYGRSGGHSK